MDFDDDMTMRYSVDRAYSDVDRGLSLDDHEHRSYLLDDAQTAEIDLTEVML